MSKPLINLIDVALFPAALMVVSKFLGLIVTINLFNLPWTIKEVPQTFFAIRPGMLSEDVIIGNSYSDLIMYLALALGFSFVLLLATHFHNTHIQPRLLMRLANSNLAGLVRSSFDIYYAAAIWLIFIWVANILIWINVLVGKTYLWIGLASLIANVVFTALLLQDVYKEIELSKRNLGRQAAF
jgi:hypothetical protein